MLTPHVAEAWGNSSCPRIDMSGLLLRPNVGAGCESRVEIPRAGEWGMRPLGQPASKHYRISTGKWNAVELRVLGSQGPLRIHRSDISNLGGHTNYLHATLPIRTWNIPTSLPEPTLVVHLAILDDTRIVKHRSLSLHMIRTMAHEGEVGAQDIARFGRLPCTMICSV